MTRMAMRWCGVLAMVAVILLPSPAQATSYLDEATQALQSDPVYVSAQVTALSTDTVAQLRADVSGESIAVVALPQSAASEVSDPAGFVRELAVRTNYQTILLAVGNTLTAGSSSLPSGRAAELASKAQQDASSLGQALTSFVSEAKALGAPAPPPVPDGDDKATSSGVLTGLLIVLAVFVVAAIGLIFFLKRRSSGGVRQERRNQKDIPEKVRDWMEKIDDLAPKVTDAQVRANLTQARQHTGQLFTRLKQQDSTELHETGARYLELLKTVHSIVDRIIDIQEHPQYYDSPTELLGDGARAVSQYVDGVVRNIREIQKGALTEFRVDVRILDASSSETPQLKES